MFKKLLTIFLFLFLFLLFFKLANSPISDSQPLENFVFCPKDKCFYFSKDGLLLDEAPELRGSLITLIRSQEIPSPDLLNYLSDIKERFESRANVKIQEINLTDYIKVITDEGWQIMLEQQGSPERLALILTNILEKEISAKGGSASGGKEKRKNLEYVNLRLENRAYYKFK